MRVRDVERPERPLPLWFQHCPPRSEGECYYSAFPPWEQLLQLAQELLVFLALPLVGVQEGLPGAVIRPGELQNRKCLLSPINEDAVGPLSLKRSLVLSSPERVSGLLS